MEVESELIDPSKVIELSNAFIEESNKPYNFTEELARLLLESDDPLLKVNMNFRYPVAHQRDTSSTDQPGYLKINGRRENDLYALLIACLKEICHRILPVAGENLFSRIKAELQEPHLDKILDKLVSLYKETQGMQILQVYHT